MDYKKILNTYHFTFTGANDVRGDEGVRTEYIFQIPSLPPLPNGESKTAIMCIKSMYIGQQDQVDNISVSSFILQIGGLSVRPTLHTAGENMAVNRFLIPNLTPHSVNPAGAFASISNVSGGELNMPLEVICGNPSGNQFTLKIFDEDENPIAANAGALNNLTFNFNFSVYLIDPDDDQNF